MRGAVAPVRLILLVILLLIAAFALWWWYHTHNTAAPVVPLTTPGTTPNAVQTDIGPPRMAALTVDELYQQARTAMGDNRMVAPAGDNALEDYLAILAKEPDNTGAQDALRELFPFATGAAEDQINQGNFDEANRIIELLAKADPSNYSLTILRSKLDAKKTLTEREQAQAAAAATAAASKPAATAPEATAAAPAITPPAPVASTPAVTEPAAPTAAPPPAVAATGETRDAEPIKAPAPQYPVAAVRNHQQGWVEVQFTVGTDGKVSAATVVDSTPPHVFDQAALTAVRQASYRPRLDNGKPVTATLRRRIEFKLGG
jgi:protein TonB